MQCPTCGNMTSYVEQYGQYYCYTCQAYIEAAQQPFPQQYDQQPQPYQSTYQQQPAAPQTQYQVPYEQTPQPGYGQVPQGFQPAEGTTGMPYQTQYSGHTPGAQQPLGAAPAMAPGIQPGYADPYGRGVPTPEKKGSKMKIVLALIVGVVVIVAAIGFYLIYAFDEAVDDLSTSDGDELTLGYMWISFGGDFDVTFMMTDGADLDDISFQILDNNSQVVEKVDPDDETLDMEGDIADIIFSQEEYDVANTTYDDEYYSRVPGNGTNHTLYITFVDVDDDGMFSDDDKMHVRGLANGGIAAEDGYILKLRNKPKGKYYQEIELGNTW